MSHMPRIKVRRALTALLCALGCIGLAVIVHGDRPGSTPIQTASAPLAREVVVVPVSAELTSDGVRLTRSAALPAP